MSLITLTAEDRQIAKRGDCAGDINIADRMMLGDQADYWSTRELVRQREQDIAGLPIAREIADRIYCNDFTDAERYELMVRS